MIAMESDTGAGWAMGAELAHLTAGCTCPACMGAASHSGSGFAVYSADDMGGPPEFALNLTERGGTSPNGKPSYTVTRAGQQITRTDQTWGAAIGQATVVSYSYAATAPDRLPDVGGWTRFSPTQIVAAELSLQSFSDVANIVFQRVGSGTSGEAAYSNNSVMVFNNFSTGQSSKDSAGFAFLPGDRTIGSEDGDVWMNMADDNNTGALPVGSYGLLTMTHEVGHAIGLSHPGDYNAGEGSPTYEKAASYYEDSKQYTIMSYFDASKTGADIQEFNSAAPLLDDIAAAQRLYGANMTTRTGDTIYGFNSNTGRAWYSVTTAAQHVVFAAWDAGGTDTFDFSGYAQAQKIDLGQGNFSDVGGLKGNVTIAFGAVIENAIGGSGADNIIGNAADNRLTGGGGNDVLNGGAGTDTAVFSGARASYTLTTNADGSVTVVDTRPGSPDGTDQLISIERYQFSDALVNPSSNLSPAVTSAVAAIMRADASATSNATLVTSLNGMGTDAAMQAIIVAARQTSSVATLSYEFFTGKVPSAAGMDYLVSPTGPNGNNLNSPYYQTFNIENRYINFAVNLGKLGEGAAQFSAAYGSKTLFDSTRDAYRTIFGSTPSDDKLHAILDPTFQIAGKTVSRADYFAIYGGDGANGIGTKAAMVGYLLTEAVKADLGTYARSNDAFLLDVGVNNAPFAIDLVGKYAKPDFVFGP